MPYSGLSRGVLRAGVPCLVCQRRLQGCKRGTGRPSGRCAQGDKSLKQLGWRLANKPVVRPPRALPCLILPTCQHLRLRSGAGHCEPSGTGPGYASCVRGVGTRLLRGR